MGRKRVKKSCTSCGFSHAGPEKSCDTSIVVEEEGTVSEAVETGGAAEAVGGESPAAPTTNPESEPTSVNYPRGQSISQSTLNEMASMENRMNSRMERFESVIVNLVSGLSIPTAAAETKTVTDQPDNAKLKANPESRRSWGQNDSSDSDTELETAASREKKKQKRRFRHKNFLQRGESVNDIDSLMMVTFRTMLELRDEGEDLSGILQHGLLLSEKSSKGVYKFEALLSYDEAIRKRAGREGVAEFGNVKQEEVMRHFCFDNSIATESKKAAKAKTKRPDKVCLRYNGEDGCSVKGCYFAHKCLACDETGHPKRD